MALMQIRRGCLSPPPTIFSSINCFSTGRSLRSYHSIMHITITRKRKNNPQRGYQESNVYPRMPPSFHRVRHREHCMLIPMDIEMERHNIAIYMRINFQENVEKHMLNQFFFSQKNTTSHQLAKNPQWDQHIQLGGTTPKPSNKKQQKLTRPVTPTKLK